MSILEKGKVYKQHEQKQRKAKAAERGAERAEQDKKRWTPERLRVGEGNADSPAAEAGSSDGTEAPVRRRRLVLKKRGESDAALAARTPPQGADNSEWQALAPTANASETSAFVAKGPDGTRGFVWPEECPSRYQIYSERRR
eukprot:SAG31_NODE_11386_length_1036_cov_1.354322_2_plen_141_part_01